ncbi:MAG: DUF2780 domain-containing protein [Bauldia sp.]|nr:DUF2780 domain-containing protein [Bauldia sp.]MCW5718858.1 DUF2780 domain-containing protein [Bauldia sp.]
MQEFVNQVASRLGVPASTASDAVGALMNLIQRSGDKGAVSDLFAKLPGARTMADDSEHEAGEAPAAGGIGGMLGGLAGKVGLGGDAGGLAGLASSGLGAGQIGTMVTMFVTWAKSKVDPALVDKVIGSIPALKNLAK